MIMCMFILHYVKLYKNNLKEDSFGFKYIYTFSLANNINNRQRNVAIISTVQKVINRRLTAPLKFRFYTLVHFDFILFF